MTTRRPRFLPEEAPPKALVLGGTGLIGSQLINLLLNSDRYEEVISLTRRETGLTHPKLREVVVNFEELRNYKNEFKVRDLYCCLGTTMKKAGSKVAFRRVDYDFPKLAAEIGHEEGVKQYLLVSSTGANANSGNFYLSVKGAIENEIHRMRFHASHVFRPSILLGDRNEERFGEEIGQSLAKGLDFLMVGPLKKYRGIDANDVAKGMLQAASLDRKGQHTWENQQIMELAKEFGGGKGILQ